jgi:hypothetical protein
MSGPAFELCALITIATGAASAPASVWSISNTSL